MTNQQLNPFEIKAELISLMDKLEGVQDFDAYSLHFKLLDEQQDKNIIVKLLFKELVNVGENAPIIKFLLIRYCDKAVLTEKLWGLIKNTMTPNLTKIIALDILRDITTDWNYENCEEYLENPDELIDEDTRQLLTAAIINPEVQIDFLDFLSSLSDEDKLTLVSSLADDYSKDELANILIPVFLADPESETGLKALELLGNSRSQLAYHALEETKKFLREEMYPKLKKSLSTLKLSGIREDNAVEFYSKLLAESKPYRFCAAYPDGMGNQALIFSRQKKGGKIQFVAVVINDYEGIKDCFGFNEISKFECDTIIDRFYKQERAVDVSPEVMKYLLENAEKISRLIPNGKIPYEYICWKNILADIDCSAVNVLSELDKAVEIQKINEENFEKMLEFDIFDNWFLTPDYSEEYEDFLIALDKDFAQNPNFDIDSFVENKMFEVFNEDEKLLFAWRVIISSYLLLTEGRKDDSELLYSLYYDEKYFDIFLKFILQRSIYEYYFALKDSGEDVDGIISCIEEKWVKTDV